jgi:hypothetical protein
VFVSLKDTEKYWCELGRRNVLKTLLALQTTVPLEPADDAVAVVPFVRKQLRSGFRKRTLLI